MEIIGQVVILIMISKVVKHVSFRLVPKLKSTPYHIEAMPNSLPKPITEDPKMLVVLDDDCERLNHRPCWNLSRCHLLFNFFLFLFFYIQDEAHKVLQSDRTQTIDHIQKCFRQKFQCSRRPSY